MIRPVTSHPPTPTRLPLPTALRENARWTRLADDIPALLVHPGWQEPRPVVIWMHGRTVTKELDPGRYLRWMRGGFAACALDLPGHGERYDESFHEPQRTLDVVLGMRDEIDSIVEALREQPEYFDLDRIGIGGMSAGGMATISRLTRDHPFVAASVEATTGSWAHQQERRMFRKCTVAEVAAIDPSNHLDGWREIPFQAFHSRIDEWIHYEGQAAFIDALRLRYEHPELIEFTTFEETGAPFEHAGFGRHAVEAKTHQVDFFRRAFGLEPPVGG